MSLRDGLSTVHRRSAGHFARHAPMESWLVFFQTVARGDQFFSSSSLLGLCPAGEASVEYSTFDCCRAEAALLSFAGSAPSLALHIHPTMDVRPKIFVALGLSRAPRACRHRLLGGLYSFPIFCCAHAYAILPVWAILSRAVPMALPHISPHRCGRCSLTFCGAPSRAHGFRGAFLASGPSTEFISITLTAHADSHTTLPN